MQRYALELTRRLGAGLDSISPSKPLTGVRGHIWEQVRLPLLVRGRFLWSPNTTGPLAVRRQVCTIHDLAPLDRPEWFNARFVAFYHWLLPKLVRHVRHIIAVSDFTRARIIDRLGVPPERVTTVPSGVANGFSPRPPQEIAATRRALGITAPRYVVAVGCVVPRKNLPRLIEAWKRVVAAGVWPDVELVLAGKPAGLMCPGYGIGAPPPRMRLVGYVDEAHLPALYSGATAALCVSLYEGFGLTPLEAMACGTPVVASNVTAIPEVVGDDAVMVDPTNPDSIAHGLCRVLEEEQASCELKARGLERARRYSWDRTADLTWQVLERYAAA